MINFNLLAVPLEEQTTVFNDGSVVGYTLDMLLSMAKDFINLLKNFKIWGEVSYFDFFIALSVMSIVIVYLINIARSPGVETTSGQYARQSRAERTRKYEEFKRNSYKEYLSNRDKK